jgi:hypothetical protein
MATLLDSALLAEDAYSPTGAGSVSCRPWIRRDAVAWGAGFAASTYTRGNETVVAFRGTDSATDWLSNALMIPLAAPGAARDTMVRVLRDVGIREPSVLSIGAPMVLHRLFSHPIVRTTITTTANQVPGEQMYRALEYFRSRAPRPTLVTGHSLGGALAQLVSLQHSVPCVAFNSPHLGNLRASTSRAGITVPGAVPMTSGIMTLVNADRDPLSALTRGVSLSHGREMLVRLPPFHRQPPSRVSPFRDGLPFIVPPIVTAARALADEAAYTAETLSYLMDVLLDGHDMQTLRVAMQGDPRFHAPVRLTVTPYQRCER